MVNGIDELVYNGIFYAHKTLTKQAFTLIAPENYS